MAQERMGPPNLPTISFIGLGNMGIPMATNLAAAGYPLFVADSRPAQVEHFVAAHPTAVAMPRSAMGVASGLTITMLPNIGIVREVMLGMNGMAF